MIVECNELWMDEEKTPERRFMVIISGDEGPSEVLRLCGKIPKPSDDRNGKWSGWKVNRVNLIPTDMPKGYSVLVEYAPPVVIVAEASDEPQFPSYAGPVGHQSDGSFILPPRSFHYLCELFIRIGGAGIKLPNRFDEHVLKLREVISQDTDTSFMEWT